MWTRCKLWLARWLQLTPAPCYIGHCSYCKAPLSTDRELWIVNRSGFASDYMRKDGGRRRLAYACGWCGPRRKVQKRQVKFYTSASA